LAEEWSVSGRCPECAAAVTWVPSYIVVQGGDTVEIGNYRCLSCGAESGKLERVVEHGRELIEPITNLGLGTPAANPIIGKGRITLNEIIKRIAKEVHEGKLDDKKRHDT
jgi:hypothetical protein